MSRSRDPPRVAATHGRCSAFASGWSSARTLLWSSISGEIAKRRFATSSGPKRSVTIQLSLNPLPRGEEARETLRPMDRHLTGTAAATSATSAACGRDPRRGALVRADALERLSADGWAALEAHGVRTVIDLRNDDEIGEDAAPRPPGLTTIRFPLDGMEDTEFWRSGWTAPSSARPATTARGSSASPTAPPASHRDRPRTAGRRRLPLRRRP